MKKFKFKKLLPFALTVALSATACAAIFAGCGGEPEPASEPKIYVVGDSTGCDYVKSDGTHSDKTSYYVVRYGYGTQLHEYLNVKKEQVVNLAASGRSSKSFTTESAANYDTLKNISGGDYLIIGFGHNDQKTDQNYYTNPNLSTTDSSTTQGSSFKYTLYENYIKLAQEKGATPILCTPIVRYNKDANYNGASGHITNDATDANGNKYIGGDYPKAIRELAAEKNVALVDLTEITKQIYIEQGTGAVQYHAYKSYSLDTDGITKIPDSLDGTHLNELGAKMVAYQFAQAIKETECSLKNLVKTDVSAPTYENDFHDRTNSSYIKPTADPFNPVNASKIWTGINEEGWYGTVFGDVGGANKITSSNFEIAAADGTFTINCKTANGKFASSTEGIAAIFKQLDSSKDFSAEVTATVTSVAGADKQSSFGLMLRDDIYIDSYNTAVKSNYVSAGVLNSGAVFAMKNEARTSTNGAMTLAEDTYTLKIEKSGKSITATVIQGETTVTQTYDVELNKSDANNMYLCLYAIRSVQVTFTNVNITVNE